MNVMIVEHRQSLATLWEDHLIRMGADVTLATCRDSAICLLGNKKFDVIIVDLGLTDGGALTVSDMAQYRQPNARVIFVTSSTFFSDGSIFQNCANACAFLPSSTKPGDLATMVEHYARPH